jgi:hypothetical protein
MARIRAAVLALSLTFCVTVANAQPFYGRPHCERDDIPLQMLESGHLKVIWHHLSLGENGQGRLGLVNETGKTITTVVVLVSYLDSDGKPIFAIPYFGGLDYSPTEIQNIRPFIKTILKQAVQPGDKFALFGTNLESTTQSPARAKATLVDTVFDDDTGSDSFSSTQATGPLLLNSPEFFEMQSDPSKIPDELLLTVALDERGRVGDVDFDQSFPHSVALESQIRSQLKLWSFFPATMTGYAVKAQLKLLFRFHDKEIPLPLPTCPLDLPDKYPRIFVMVDLQREDDRRWNVMYGGKYARGKFHTIVSIDATVRTTNDSIHP